MATAASTQAASSGDGRLRWLLRRGMKELDVMMERYYAHRYHAAPVEERASFLRLLTLAEDPDIWAWTMDFQPVPAEYEGIIEQLRIHR